MNAIAKWLAEARRRGQTGLAHASGGLTIAMAVGLASLPGLPYVARQWGPAPQPSRQAIAAAITSTPTLPRPEEPAERAIEVVRTRPLATATLPAHPSPTPAERAAVEAATAQQRVGFKPKKPVEKTPEAQPAPSPPASAPAPAATPAGVPETEAAHWSETEVATALKTCIQLLGPLAANVETLAPIRQDKCGTPAPVALKRVGTGAQSVEFSPPAVLNCAMVAKINDWVEKVLQPTAREAFGASVIRMNSTSGYVCRGRNGDMMPSGKISEHALANALDVASFTLSDGRVVDVGKNWGPTRRDHARGAVPDAKEAAAASAPQASTPARPQRGTAQAAPALQAVKAPVAPEAVSKEGQFLRDLHKGACSLFGTVLGPEANDAHREHFHFDLHPRRQSHYCQ